jgi:penicillin V acylase-like amidase (Ntn superfamily)
MEKKVFILGRNWGSITEKDYTEQYTNLINLKGLEFADNYFRNGSFEEDEINANANNHFLKDFLKNLEQTDDYPKQLRNEKFIRVIVENPFSPESWRSYV